MDGPIVKDIVSYLKVQRTGMLELLLGSYGDVNGFCISLGLTQVNACTNSFNNAQIKKFIILYVDKFYLFTFSGLYDQCGPPQISQTEFEVQYCFNMELFIFMLPAID